MPNGLPAVLWNPETCSRMCEYVYAALHENFTGPRGIGGGHDQLQSARQAIALVEDVHDHLRRALPGPVRHLCPRRRDGVQQDGKPGVVQRAGAVSR